MAKNTTISSKSAFPKALAFVGILLFIGLGGNAQTTSLSETSEHLRVTNIRNIDGSEQVLISSTDPSSPYYSPSQENTKYGNGIDAIEEWISPSGCYFDLEFIGFHTDDQKSAIRAGLGNAVKNQSINNSEYPVKIKIVGDYGLGNALASTSTDWILTDFIGTLTWYPSILFEHLLGENSNGNNYDVEILWNKTLTWDCSTTGGSASDYNLMYVIMHEFTHGMDVSSSANKDGSLYTLGWSGSPNVFDLRIRDGNGTVVWGNPNYSSSTELGAFFTSNNVWFELNNSGEMIKLYAPTTWSGQAISHVDDQYEFSTNQLMTPFYNINTIHLDVGWFVKRVHQTNGWTLNSMTPPVTDFSVNNQNPNVGQVITFTDDSSNGPVEWLWDFGDGNTSTEKDPTHSYATSGTYTVKLMATNWDGEDEEEKVDYITATTAVIAPVAEFSATPLNGDAPLFVNFTDQSTNAPSSWSWTFGDGGTSTDQNPSHDYTTPGVYTVVLTATNSAGSDDETKNDYITVTTAVVTPVAEFSATPLSGTAPLFVNFTDLSTNTPTSWSWTFGDGGTSTAQNPSHEYENEGSYDVGLTVYNGTLNDTEIKVGYITVAPPDQPVIMEISSDPAAFQTRDFEAGVVTDYTNALIVNSSLSNIYNVMFGENIGVITGGNLSGTGTETLEIIAVNEAGSDTAYLTFEVYASHNPLPDSTNNPTFFTLAPIEVSINEAVYELTLTEDDFADLYNFSYEGINFGLNVTKVIVNENTFTVYTDGGVGEIGFRIEITESGSLWITTAPVTIVPGENALEMISADLVNFVDPGTVLATDIFAGMSTMWTFTNETYGLVVHTDSHDEIGLTTKEVEVGYWTRGPALEQIIRIDVTNGTQTVSRSFPMDGVTGVIDFGNELTKNELGQNYPNPFMEGTTIPVFLSNSSQVRIELYDINGSLLRVLVDKEMSAGQHEIQLSAYDLPSGLYIVRMKTPEFTGILKIRNKLVIIDN